MELLSCFKPLQLADRNPLKKWQENERRGGSYGASFAARCGLKIKLRYVNRHPSMG